MLARPKTVIPAQERVKKSMRLQYAQFVMARLDPRLSGSFLQALESHLSVILWRFNDVSK